MNYELSTAGSPVAGILNGKFGFGKLIRHCRPLLSAVLEYGIGRFCHSQGIPRGRETDSPADEYDPTESVALRDYSVLFIFNKLGSRVAVPPPRGGGSFQYVKRVAAFAPHVPAPPRDERGHRGVRRAEYVPGLPPGPGAVLPAGVASLTPV